MIYFWPRTRYRFWTSIIFVILYRYFVLRKTKIDDRQGDTSLSEIPQPLFNKKHRFERWEKIYEAIDQLNTEESMQALYTLLLEWITFTYGKVYEYMTLQEIQHHKKLPKHIVDLLARLYQPIYNTEEKTTEEKQKIAKEIKEIVQ